MSQSLFTQLMHLDTRQSCAIAVVFGLFCSFSSPLHAENKALIIGVGDYQSDDISKLPGIDIDLNTMNTIALKLGYKQSNILQLSNSEATIDNMAKALTGWLREGVSEDDQILIYYTGHGAQLPDANGDESDGLDEFLLAYDVNVADGVVSGVLLDDHFYNALQGMPTKNVMLIVDACHSGTGFKDFSGLLSGVDGGVAKFQRVADTASSIDGGFSSKEGNDDMTFLALTAAADSETSIATTRGSIFTNGLRQVLSDTLGQGQSITPNQLLAGTREYVKSELAAKPQYIFTPQIGGDDSLFDKPLQLIPVASARDDLNTLVGSLKPLNVSANKKTYPLGDRSLRITIDVPAEGYLNIVTVDPNDKAVVLYPNKFNLSNKVNRGAVSLPTAEMNFDLEAQGPIGQHAIYAFWTTNEVNWYKEGGGQRNEKGELEVVFSELSEYSKTRFMPVERKSEGALGGVITVDMVN